MDVIRETLSELLRACFSVSVGGIIRKMESTWFISIFGMELTRSGKHGRS
jgi:hypothetical protein